MPDASWYWHRLRAMDVRETAHHVRRRMRQRADRNLAVSWSAPRLEHVPVFPRLPESPAPEPLRADLDRLVDELLRGRWKALGHLELLLDDPPRWHRDYLRGVDLTTTESAFGLDHRALPEGADVRLMWELSRWQILVRLAQAAFVLDRRDAAATCLRWLSDWTATNPPFVGWNWTSALESGIRLIQIAWIDALLRAARGADEEDQHRLADLVQRIVPPHVWFTSRYRSFGSSANNHLLGELSGLIVAAIRWPLAQTWSCALATLVAEWEQAVMTQFAEDGGNREQALNYHLFAWELCRHTSAALEAASMGPRPAVAQRLQRAAAFYAAVQVAEDPWDYGDSDGALVAPLWEGETSPQRQWRAWMVGGPEGATLRYWLGAAPPQTTASAPGVAQVIDEAKAAYFPQSGIAISRPGDWTVRWDLSPLGFLSTAAHGHLDVLHLSIWRRGVALVVDPGTGAYYSDPELRRYLASAEAHNGPRPDGMPLARRAGTFLWAGRHDPPALARKNGRLEAVLESGRTTLRRALSWVNESEALEVLDSVEGPVDRSFSVRWQLAPGSTLADDGPRRYRVGRGGVTIVIEAGDEWDDLEIGRGLVSPHFRSTAEAPFLLLRSVARAGKLRPCRTTFRCAS
ncbi:MAG TPA: alginate lyase family protein [Thermoanaerobaculia bacterium]|nr:alginate lyase family protein [Thermoanaerobaculia bacterium]